MTILSLFFTILISTQSFATQSISCIDAEKKFQSRFEKLEKDYTKYSSHKFIKDNKPTFKIGTNTKIVYLLHGFIGSPFEMKPIARLLTEKGYTVVNDLIPGHGVNGRISNFYDERAWKAHVKENLDDLQKCSNDISVVGFSTGGLLIHDYMSSNPNFKPQAAVFYSPFYKPHLAFLAWIKDLASWITPTVAVSPLYTLSRFQDIQVAVLDKDHYMQQIPLDTATVIQKLGKEVYNKPILNSETPTLLFVSENDQVLNSDVTLEKIKTDFKTVQIQLFAKKQKIPHHLMVDSVSSAAEVVQRQGAEFILYNSKTTK
jgi:esterase/lipase